MTTRHIQKQMLLTWQRRRNRQKHTEYYHINAIRHKNMQNTMSCQFTLTSENHDTQFRRRMKSATPAPSSVQVGQTMNEVAARWWFISSSARFAHSGVLLTAPVNCYSVPSGLRCIVAAFCAVLSHSSNKNYKVFRIQKYLKCCCISVDYGRHSLCIFN